MAERMRAPYAEALVGGAAAGVTALGNLLRMPLVFTIGLVTLIACVASAAITLVLSLAGEKAQWVACAAGAVLMACGGASYGVNPGAGSGLLVPLGLGLVISAGITLATRR